MTADIYRKAMDRLNRLMTEARARGAVAAETASLATADTSARPSVRMITIMELDHEGPLFFVNQNSGKGRQLTENPWASLCFYWPQVQEQVIVEGAVEAQPESVSDRYWRMRSRETQLVAWASDQSEPVDQKGKVKEKVSEYRHRFDSERVARPDNWRAFRILPARIEFWPTGWHRVRERVRYVSNEEGEWLEETVAP